MNGCRCYIDLRDSTGPYISWAMSTIQLLTFVFNTICYLLVWNKLRNVAATQGGLSSKQAKYRGTARIMMLFVAIYLIQWWPMVVYGFWAMAQQPHWSITLTTVIIVNQGGSFNFFVYTWMRKKLARTEVTNQNDMTSTAMSVAPSKLA